MAVFWQASILQTVILTLICMFESTMCGCAKTKFTSVGSDRAICPSATPVSSARNDAECAMACGRNSSCRSFGFASPFVAGSCLVSEGDNCTLRPEGKTFMKPSFPASGPMATGTTVMIMQRFVGDVSFARPWLDYDNGFGNSNGDFWLGLRNIKNLLGSSSATLRVEMKDWNGALLFAEFNGFTVGDSSTNYTMNYAAEGDKNATIMQTLVESNLAFSTMDRDNDKHSGACTQTHNGNGGFWLSGCGRLFPTAVYPPSMLVSSGYMGWYNGALVVPQVIPQKEIRIYFKR